ncbi:hypothetical protein [Mesorhizobium sp. B2-4-6]|uniref:hypothetical protein n=1 Tax=Mesorhizobium sp. B2-4-6 TaxID=2589943 RepID=UPI001126BD96|nr:hypothetical protein [Mesorhizobium sp. B2-4-6]TPL40707.1 hypothetical protein FJ957_26105 [Mesorhizobium sp. B2-4-6]
MKRAVLLILLLSVQPVAADTISPKGCRLLAESAEQASMAISGVVAATKGDKMADVISNLPPDQMFAAAEMERTRKAALGPMQAYSDAMAAFAKAMRQCSGDPL